MAKAADTELPIDLGTAIAPTPRKPLALIASAATTTLSVDVPPALAIKPTRGFVLIVDRGKPECSIAFNALI